MDSFPVSKVVPFPVRDTAFSLCSMSGSSLSERLWKPDNPLMESNSGYCCLYPPPQTHMKIYGRGGLSTYTAGLGGSRTGGTHQGMMGTPVPHCARHNAQSWT